MTIKCVLDFDIKNQHEVIKDLEVGVDLLIRLFEHKINGMEYKERRKFIEDNNITILS